MPRATTARRPAPEAEPSTPEQFARSILVLISGIERHDAGAPAALAFRAALARKGREIAAAGGPAALADMLARVRADDPTRAADRTSLIRAAWSDLPSDAAGGASEGAGEGTGR